MHQLSYVSRLDVWILHDSDKIHLIKRILISDSLRKREESNWFLKPVVTGNEKWIVHNNIEHKRSWGQRSELLQTTSRQGFIQTRLYSQSRGIRKVSFFISYFRRTEQSIQMYTVPNWTNWMQLSTRSV